MALDLAGLLDPTHTALVTQECQNGVIGDDAVLRDLADEAHQSAVPNIVRLVQAARAAGVAVVHCLGIGTSMFSAVVVSRAIVNLVYGHRRRVAHLSIGDTAWT